MLNSAVAESVFKSYKEFATKYPDDTASANYLFKAAELANGMKRFRDAIDLYGQFREKYPDHWKVAVSLFLQAFIYDNDLRDKEFRNEKLTEEEMQAILNFDRFRLNELTTLKNDFDFKTRIYIIFV